VAPYWFDLALAGQLSEVALGGGAADADLFRDLGGRNVIVCGFEQLADVGHGRTPGHRAATVV